MSRQDASSNYYGYPLLIRAVWLYRPNLSPVIPIILHWDGLRFRSSQKVQLFCNQLYCKIQSNFYVLATARLFEKKGAFRAEICSFTLRLLSITSRDINFTNGN